MVKTREGKMKKSFALISIFLVCFLFLNGCKFKDKKPPTITATVRPQPNENGWHNSDVTVSFTCKDVGWGIKTCPDPVILNTENSNHQVTGTAVDRAGNKTSTTVYVKLDKTPPLISHTLNPEPNTEGWNTTDVSVGFNCSDSLSGVDSCSDTVLVTHETPAKTVPGAVMDKAGNTADSTALVRIDKTPPILHQKWPPVNDFTTDLSTIQIEGNVEDNLSGVAGIKLQDHTGTEALSFPNHSVERNLKTDIPPQHADAETWFEISMTDVAGNMSGENFLVRHTKGSYMLPTDSERTELTQDGVITSIDRAIISFKHTLNQSQVRELIGRYGGRIAGYLKTLNTVMAIFPTDTIQELTAIIENISNESNVVAALPVIFLNLYQAFDNDQLQATIDVAYEHIRSTDAAHWIVDNNLPMSPTGVAILDTGLDRSYGRNNEFNHVRFFDLCTSQGRAGIQGTALENDPEGHGTKITSIIAGANNGEGNNGLTSGFPQNPFKINVLRIMCGDPNMADLSLVLHALSMITDGDIGNIDVVNMSFGIYINDPWCWVRLGSTFERYFGDGTGIYPHDGEEILWISAAGNLQRATRCNPPEARGALPANLACFLGNVVSVAGYRPTLETLSTESTFGESVTLYAPSEIVWAADEVGDYGDVYGTSAASALVSGAAAMLRSIKPQNPYQVKLLLTETAQELSDPLLWQGGLDVLKLIQSAGFPPLRRFFRQSTQGSGDESGGSKITLIADHVDRPMGLAGFFFNFRGHGVDHHIKTVAARNYFFNNAIVGEVEFVDKNGDDRYEWRHVMQELPPGTVYHRKSATIDPIDTSIPLAPPPAPGWIPALVGFSVQWDENTDRHIRGIRVGIDYDNLKIKFQDKNNKRSGKYIVDYAYIPPERVKRVSGLVSGSGQDKKYYSRSIFADNPVLQYFQLNLPDGKDMHIDELGVILTPGNPGKAEIWYNDKHDDDVFDWSIRYVDVF